MLIGTLSAACLSPEGPGVSVSPVVGLSHIIEYVHNIYIGHGSRSPIYLCCNLRMAATAASIAHHTGVEHFGQGTRTHTAPGRDQRQGMCLMSRLE